MGKLFATKYSDVDHRIFKKSSKKDKCDKKLSIKPQAKPSNESGKSSSLQQIKRKFSTSKENDEPKRKITKTGNVYLPKRPVLLEPGEEKEIIKPITQIVQGSDSDDIRLILKEDNTSDLFFLDELKSSYENYVRKDFSFRIIDEISLEGLDGITIEAFWKRLLMGLDCPLNISENLREQIWQLISKNEYLQFFQLVEPRGVLDIYDRFKYVDTDIGVVMELAFELPDIYPHEPVNHPDVQGSCSTFNTRVNISSEVRNLCLKDIERKYDRSLVIVADQQLRRSVLFNEAADPTIELMNLEYCVLERIGRSRKHGELTQGNMSITSHLNMDPKSFFHYKKHLMQYNLLVKQFFYIKSALTDQNKTGRLLHLKRFYHKVKPKQLVIAEQIINLIKKKPDCRIEYTELRKVFPENPQSLAKVVKGQEFHRYVKTDCLYPYRTLYPNAKKSEYMRKAQPVEKYIKCLELIDPYINIVASWCNIHDDSDDDSEDEEVVTGGKIYNMECFKEVFCYILSKGKQGCSLMDVRKHVGIDNNTIRMVLKKLVAKNVVNIRKCDRGKQRHLIYYARCLEGEDITVNLNPDPPKLPSNVLSKIKQRQRAGREMLKQETPAAKAVRLDKNVTSFPRMLEIEVPDLKYPCFIRDFSTTSFVLCEQYLKAEFNIPRSYLLKLSNKLIKSKETFNINQILSEIDSNLSLPQIKVNFDQSYTAKGNVNYITKLILLKAALGEVIINSETLNCLSRKRKLPMEMNFPKLSDNVDKGNEKSKIGDDKLQYMGDSPNVVFNEKDGDVCTKIIVSTPPTTFKDVGVYPRHRELSERVWSRLQIILNVIYEKKIFEDIYKMLKVIGEEEIKDGYQRKIDRKSLARLLKKLVEEGYIKVYKLVICDGKITKTQSFLCHPAVNHTDSLIKSACEQLKWKYFVGTHKKAVKPYMPSVQKDLEDNIQKQGFSPFKESDVMNSIAELKEMNKWKFMEVKTKYNRHIGRSYGFKPKFIRMRIVHEFLFYLIYGYSKKSVPLKNSEVEQLFKSYRIDLTREDLTKIPKMWCTEISWKMFIPPLPYHKGWIDGWALMCDIILRLPISVLCKIHNCPYELPELLEVLNHPIKRFYLVKDLSESIRNAVLFKRKYLFDINETMNRLAYCGLLQFGPQKYKEKDQIFIYLNRRASLLDTTTSEPAYHKISNKEYRQIAFFLNTQADVDSYWYNVYGLSLNTKLNAKQGGQLITLVDVSAKPELVRAITSKTPEQALEDDNGEIPGDKRGASGLDSSLWSHILRNWFWASKKIKVGGEPSPAVMGLRQEKLDKILPRNLPYNELNTFHGNSKVYLHTNSKDAVKESKLKKGRKCIPMPLKPSKTLQKITRKIPYRQKKSSRQYYDWLDKIILKKSGANMRVRWNDREDKMLLLCRAASIFLNPRFPKKQSIPYTVIRDVLRRVCPESKNKTSRACQRRMKLHVASMYPNIEDTVSNLFRLEPILNYYSVLVNNLSREKTHDDKPFKLKEAQLSAAFVILMSYMVQHAEEIENILQGNLINVDHLTEENLHNIENNLIELEESPLKHEDAKDEDDVKKNVLKAVIHSSLGTKNEPGWAFQLFKIYQKYPDNLIRDAVGELKRTQAISFNRLMTKKDKVRWYTPFQLSNIYVFAQSTTFNDVTAVEAYNTYLNVKQNMKFLEFSQENIESKKYGQLLALNEFFSIWEKIQFKFYLPQSTVILNPHIKDHSELINELAVRLQTQMKKMIQESIETEQEPETETDNDRLIPTDMEIAPVCKENTSTPQTSRQTNLKSVDDLDTDITCNSPLDLNVDVGNSETINRLKTWVTDCMETKRERRSPSPEFINLEEEYSYQGVASASCGLKITEVVPENENCDAQVEKINKTTVKKPHNKEQVPTLEEIKEGMLKYTPTNEERQIPYITDLSSLLNKENFTELNTDEKTLERLKNHFIYQYALLEDFTLEEYEQLKDFYMIEYLEQSMRNKSIWDKIRCQMVVKDPGDISEVLELLVKEGGTQNDFKLAKEIIAFVYEKAVLGTKATEIKKHFRHLEQNCSLEVILKVLTDTKILLQAGICSITFVHYTYQSTWLIETFVLSCDEQKLLEEKTAKAQKEIKQNIEKHLQEKKLIRVKVMPWIKVDGTLSAENFKIWLCNILSHCLDYPKISVIKLCEKFCYIKPVDIYFLLEILQELNCIEIFLYNMKEQTLFSSWEYVKESYATFLDDFEDMYVAPCNVSMICLGSFLHEN